MTDPKHKPTNVIPFSINGVIFTDLDEPADMTNLSLAELVDAIDAEDFEGQSGQLAN